MNQRTRKLQKKISELVKTFPKKEQYRLAGQIVRSSRSVARSIAEGYGRYHIPGEYSILPAYTGEDEIIYNPNPDDKKYDNGGCKQE